MSGLDGFIEIENKQDDTDDWRTFWVGMPEFIQEKENEYSRVTICFKTEEDFKKFADKVNQPVSDRTKAIWHPYRGKELNRLSRWIEE